MIQGLRVRLTWMGGLLLVWATAWLLLGIRFLLLVGSTPHPFLPQIKYTGVMLKALTEWAAWALAAYLSIGLISGWVLFLWQRLGKSENPADSLGFRRGLWMGLGTLLVFHGILYLEVPIALAMIQGIRHIPMGLTLALLFGIGLWALSRAFRTTPRSAWRLIGGSLSLALLIQLPHDLFRALVVRSNPVPKSDRRLLVLGIDGLRQDVAEKAMPAWKAPGGCQPVVAVPATRLTWNMLLGADPGTFQNHRVIPFKSEVDHPPQPGLLDAAAARNIRTAFLIDDPTTLSFYLSRTPFDDVYEPGGGWKHYFTVGAGTCWPVYSWAENYFTVVETTNPWSDSKAFFRDVERALVHHQWVSAHTCQLHAPFYLRLDEIQVLRPWVWLFHPAHAYKPYQSLEEAEKDEFGRQGGRANPVNHYRIRVTRVLRNLAEFLPHWELKYPELSGLMTSDHGEEHYPVVTPDGTLVSFLDGMHGFTLSPETVRVPLHPFGKTQSNLNSKDVYSWLDMRDDLGRWIVGGGSLGLTRTGPEGWVLSFPTVQAIHTQPKELRDQGGVEGAGMKPQDFVRQTYLGFQGHWFMDDLPPIDDRDPGLSWMVIGPDKATSFNPIGVNRYLKGTYSGYKLESVEEVTLESLLRQVEAAQGKRPSPWAQIQ